MKHVKGPWIITNATEIRGEAPYAEFVAECCYKAVYGKNPERGCRPTKKEIANTYLISAAPELLEACKLGLERVAFEEQRTGSDYCKQLRVIIEQAIAKAEGR